MLFKKKPQPKWTAYYTEGRVFDSEKDKWQELPDEGVLAIVEHKDTGRTIFNGGDWYYMDKGVLKYISSGAEWGTWKPKPKIRCKSCIKKGVYTPKEEFDVLIQRIYDNGN